jgi:hypothetical protein
MDKNHLLSATIVATLYNDTNRYDIKNALKDMYDNISRVEVNYANAYDFEVIVVSDNRIYHLSDKQIIGIAKKLAILP